MSAPAMIALRPRGPLTDEQVERILEWIEKYSTPTHLSDEEHDATENLRRCALALGQQIRYLRAKYGPLQDSEDYLLQLHLELMQRTIQPIVIVNPERPL